jgi:tellurite resistance protein
MLGLLAVLLLATAGVFLSFRLSPAAKLRARLRDALSHFEELDSVVQGLRQALKCEIESQTQAYIQAIYTKRLKAIPVDELKKHATGMRLQALKDIGIRTVADLEGWNDYRVSQVRGVGPKSAYAIVRSVAAVIAAAKAVPIPPPAVPFSEVPERRLLQLLYRERWFTKNLAEQESIFAAVVISHQSTRDAILMKTTFGNWLWKFGANPTIRRCLGEGDALIKALADQALQERRTMLSQSISECRTICANPVPIESIIQDFTDERTFYDAYFSKKFLASNRVISVPETIPNPSSGPVHVEFSRVVAGPPPQPSGSGTTDLAPDAKNSPQQEKLFSVSVGSTTGQAATEFILPSAPPSLDTSHLRWLKKGEAVEIQGHHLRHGFIYTGKGINGEQHYVVNPSLSAKPGDLTSADATGYYSSYSLFSPDKRSLYLKWLAAGAQSASDSSFGMLYFYGIERRFLDLLQQRASNPCEDEREQLFQEIQRIANLFKNAAGSITQCCARLFDFAAAYTLDKNRVPELPKEWIKTWELPFSLRYGIGWFMKERRPIPVEWALRWAYVEPSIYLRTPATRCPDEFEAAFAAAYRSKFGDGLVLPVNKARLKLTYQPGWPVHSQGDVRSDFSDIPDVAALTGPQQKLKALVEEATAAIDGFSRYLGRNPAKSGCLEAYLTLPLPLWPSAAVERWHQFLTSFVEPVQPLPLESLLHELDPSGDLSLPRLPEIAGHLNSALVGFEPDILSGARRPKQTEMVVLFPLTSESEAERTTAEYKRASLIVSLSACVALADGNASEDEERTVEAMISSWEHLGVDLRSRLRAQYRLQVRNGISLANLKSRLANLTSDGRLQMALSLCSLAAADGNIATDEVKLLEQIYRALELEPQLLYSHLHLGQQPIHNLDAQASTNNRSQATYCVDSARLEALRRETEQVSALLAGVFAEEEPPSSSKPEALTLDSAEENLTKDELLPGLDTKHQQFLAEILSRPSWTREQLQATAQRLQIMLDGALERINDATFDLFGEPVTEGDDPIYVQQNILEAAE